MTRRRIKSSSTLGEEKCTPREKSARPEKILATRMRKGPRLTLVLGPRMVNPAMRGIRGLAIMRYIGLYLLLTLTMT